MSNFYIRVEHSNGQQRTILVNSTWTYAQLHNQILQIFGGHNELSVIFGNKYLSVNTQGTATLEQLGLTNNCVIKVLEKMSNLNLTIRVQSMWDQDQTIQAGSSWTYAQLYNKFLQIFGSESGLFVNFRKKSLNLNTQGTTTLERLGFTNNCIILVFQEIPNFWIRVEDKNGQHRSIRTCRLWTYAQLHNKFLQMFGSQSELSVIFENKYLSVNTHGTATLEQLGLTNNCDIRVLQEFRNDILYFYWLLNNLGWT